MKKSMIILLFSLLCLSMNVSVFAGKKPPRKYKKIQKYMNRATSEKLSGVTIYIQSPKYGEWTATSGYADVESKQVLQKDHIFQWGV